MSAKWPSYTRRDAMEPKHSILNRPRYALEMKAPAREAMLEEPDHIFTTLTSGAPPMLYLRRRHTVRLAIKLIEASFSNDSLPANTENNP